MGRGGAGARSRAGGKRVSGEGKNSTELREAPVPGTIPRFEIPSWQEKFGVVAGITGRGSPEGRGFDVGLWSKEPVGEVMSRWLAFRRSMTGFQAVALGNQVHGVELMTLGASYGWIQLEGIDGWITSTPGILLTVTIADCVPVYLVVPGRAIALLHAGWRGTAGGILTRGVKRLVAETGCAGGDIVMHCGVGICGPCYEVGSEVMLGCGVPADGSGPWHIDLRERLAAEAMKLGVTSISSSPWCSAHDRASFYSHRASGGTDGRMVAYVGMAVSG
jgi:copper oxidase (laccase) domain-containing protein